MHVHVYCTCTSKCIPCVCMTFILHAVCTSLHVHHMYIHVHVLYIHVYLIISRSESECVVFDEGDEDLVVEHDDVPPCPHLDVRPIQQLVQRSARRDQGVSCVSHLSAPLVWSEGGRAAGVWLGTLARTVVQKNAAIDLYTQSNN